MCDTTVPFSQAQLGIALSFQQWPHPGAVVVDILLHTTHNFVALLVDKVIAIRV